MNNNVLSYHGDVKLMLRYKGKTVEFDCHNNGTGALFESLSNYLAGVKDKIIENDIFVLIPNTFDIRVPKGETVNPLKFNETTESILKVDGSIPITRVDVSHTNKGESNIETDYPHTEITYEATITYDYLQSSLTSSTSYYLCLSGSKKDVLAYIEIDEYFINAITPGTQAIISWVMNINNREGN